MIEFIIGIVVSLFVAFFYGRNTGKQKDTKEKVETIQKTKEVENEINKMHDDAVRERASKWVRNKDN